MNEKPKNIYELLNVTPIEKQSLAPIIGIEQENKDEMDAFEADFEAARLNLLYVIESAKKALEDVHVIAKEKEGSKEYDSFNGLLKTVGESSQTLLKMHSERKKFKEKSRQKDEIKNGIAVNNAVFVGSSSEFKKMLRGSEEN